MDINDSFRMLNLSIILSSAMFLLAVKTVNLIWVYTSSQLKDCRVFSSYPHHKRAPFGMLSSRAKVASILELGQ